MPGEAENALLFLRTTSVTQGESMSSLNLSFPIHQRALSLVLMDSAFLASTF